MTWTDRLGELGVWRRSSDIDEATAAFEATLTALLDQDLVKRL